MEIYSLKAKLWFCCETHAKGWIMLHCPSSGLQGKLSHQMPCSSSYSQCNFYGVSDSRFSLMCLWKLHHNLAPRKFTFGKHGVAWELKCPFVTNSLKQAVWCVNAQLITKPQYSLVWVYSGSSEREKAHILILLLLRLYILSLVSLKSKKKKNKKKVGLARLTSSECSMVCSLQCTLWLHDQIF